MRPLSARRPIAGRRVTRHVDHPFSDIDTFLVDWCHRRAALMTGSNASHALVPFDFGTQRRGCYPAILVLL